MEGKPGICIQVSVSSNSVLPSALECLCILTVGPSSLTAKDNQDVNFVEYMHVQINKTTLAFPEKLRRFVASVFKTEQLNSAVLRANIALEELDHKKGNEAYSPFGIPRAWIFVETGVAQSCRQPQASLCCL